MTQKLGILIQDSKWESIYDPPFDDRWSGSIAPWLATFIFYFFKNKLQDLCIHFQVITTAQLYILFKIVGFIILVIFVAFWLLSFNWSVVCILNIFNTPPIPQQNQLLTNDIHSDMYWLSPPFVKRKTPFFLYLSPLFIPKSTCLRIGVLYIRYVQIQQFFNV